MHIKNTVVDRDTELEQDRALFDKYTKRGLISIKNLVMKSPKQRNEKEVEFLILYLRFKHSSVFKKCDKKTIF